eukprot:scaffold10.g2418.t1
MATCLVLPQQPSSYAPMPYSFKGDTDLLVDSLIAASRKREVSDADLKERALVPFQFDSDVPPPAAAKALEALRRRGAAAVPAGAGVKRGAERSASHLAASPPRKESERQQGRHAPRKPASSASSAGSAPSSGAGKHAGNRKHHRDPSVKSLPALAATAGAGDGTPGRQSPPRKRAEATPSAAPHAAAPRRFASSSGGKAATVAAPTAPASAPGKFAGPAFFNSPTPDQLPLPKFATLQL